MGKNHNTPGRLSPAKKIALSAILSALGVIFLTLGALAEVLDLSSAAIAGFATAAAVIEIGGYYPAAIYFVVSIVSLIILPNKYPAVYFIFFGGFYPIFKAYVERFHYVIAWTVKFSMFNTFLALMILSVKFLTERGFLPPFEDSNFYNFFENFKIIIFIIANFVFLLYDIAMTRIINLYIIKIRGLIGLKNYF